MIDASLITTNHIVSNEISSFNVIPLSSACLLKNRTLKEML